MPETIAGDRPPRYGIRNVSSYRRAWALACHTRMREGSPRHAPIARKPARMRGAEDHALRSLKRSRGTGPRATVFGTSPLTVGLGPSHATRACERVPLAMHRSRENPIGYAAEDHALWSLKRSRGTGPRATVTRTATFTVGRGPVPRHATTARKTGPRAKPTSVVCDRLITNGSGSGDPDLQG